MKLIQLIRMVVVGLLPRKVSLAKQPVSATECHSDDSKTITMLSSAF